MSRNTHRHLIRGKLRKVELNDNETYSDLLFKITGKDKVTDLSNLKHAWESLPLTDNLEYVFHNEILYSYELDNEFSIDNNIIITSVNEDNSLNFVFYKGREYANFLNEQFVKAFNFYDVFVKGEKMKTIQLLNYTNSISQEHFNIIEMIMFYFNNSLEQQQNFEFFCKNEYLDLGLKSDNHLIISIRGYREEKNIETLSINLNNFNFETFEKDFAILKKINQVSSDNNLYKII